MPGTIIVKPIQAKLTKEERGLVKLDPYCVAIIGDRHAESDICKKGGKNPAWHDALSIKRVDEPYCYLEVKDKSLVKDKMLGICAIDLDDLAKQGNVQKWYELYYDKKPAGEILIEASVAPDDGARALSPERIHTRVSIFNEGSATKYGSAHKDSLTRHDEHIVGHSPFQKKIFDTPVSGLETAPSSMAYMDKDQFRYSSVDQRSNITAMYENQGTMRDIASTIETRDFNSMTYQTGLEGNYGGIYTIKPESIEVDESLKNLNKTVDEILERSRAMDEERRIRESRLPYQIHPIQEFQRQDSIPNENAGAEGVPLFPETHPGPVHASHDKFGDDSNAVSKVAEFKVRVIEKLERGKDTIRERISTMKDKENFDEKSSQPSMKYKVLTGLEKAMTKGQYPQSERKAPKEKIEEEQKSVKKGNFKEKILGGVEQLTHSSIKTLSKLEGKLREKRGEDFEHKEEQEEEHRHSKSAKKESLKERIEYIKDMSREKVLAKLRKPGVDEEIQTENQYIGEDVEGEKPGKVQMIKDKVGHIKDVAMEKLEEIKHNKKGHTESQESSSSSSSEEEETIGEKIKGGIQRGVKKAAVKIAKKRVQKAEKNDDSSEEDHEGIIDKVKGKVEKEAKHIAIKAAKRKILKAEDKLEQPKRKESHKKTELRKSTKRSASPDENSEENAFGSHPGRIEAMKEALVEGVEKIKGAIKEKQSQTEDKKPKKRQETEESQHDQATLKQKFMAEIEQIMSAAKEKIAQFSNKETEDHENAQQAYNEFERSTERTFEYQEMLQGRSSSLNNELIEGMKDLTETLDRLQQKIEARISSHQTYEQYGSSIYESTITPESHHSSETPGVLVALKERVKEGVEQLKSMSKAKDNENSAQPGSIASLMDKLSQDIQNSNIDDRIYLTKEYKESLEDEQHLKSELREARMRTLKLKVKEGVEQVKNMAHNIQDSGMSHHSGAEEQQSGMIDTIKEKIMEGVEQVKNMAHLNQESTVTYHETGTSFEPNSDVMNQPFREMSNQNEDFGIYSQRQESVTEFEVDQQNKGAIENIKQKVMEGVEQIKNIAHISQGNQGSTIIHHEAQVASGPIADLMDELSEEISKPKETSEQHPGMIDNLKQKVMEGIEQVKHMAHMDKDQSQQIFDDNGAPDMMISLQDETQNPRMAETLKQKIKEGIEQVKNLTHKNEASDARPFSETGVELTNMGQDVAETPESTIFKFDYREDIAAPTEEHKSAGIFNTIKQKIHDGIETVKGMVQHQESETSIVENEVDASEAFTPHHELKRSPESSARGEEGRMAESIYITGDNELGAGQSDMFQSVSFGGGSGANYAFEESRETESRPIENIIYESQYVKKTEIVVGNQEGSETQMLGNESIEKPLTQFDKAFADFTGDSNQFNW